MAVCARSGKTIYASSGEAHRAIASLRRKRRRPSCDHARKAAKKLHLHIYRCGSCGGFHTTSRERGELRRIIEAQGEVFHG